MIAAALAGALYIRNLESSMSVGEDVRQSLQKSETGDTGSGTASEKSFYMMLVGTDARTSNENGRSDSLMLARVDPESHRLDIISIPRDMQVNIKGVDGVQKINAAYSYGGAALAVSTVSEFAGVPISHYAEVDFANMTGLVDHLGGITVIVPESFSGGNSGLSLKAGEQTLNGEQMLGFTRERYQVQGGDFSRAQAQQLVLLAIMQKIMAQPKMALPGLIQELASAVSTDMNVSSILQLTLKFYGQQPQVQSAICPSYAFDQDGVSYVGVEYNEWRDMMQRVDAGMGPRGTGSIPAAQSSNAGLGAAANAASPRDYAALKNQSLNSGDIIQ
ncbi:LytR family transcriptional regulator [Bifidobacterium reuteri]|uniref:LytR family transcriptional regulator n=2 Tax=Bifidobacterium reuteri TaxID=983706 RepID=A0A5J5E7R7_9BIFI|nr:LytR family transcriptional regulator [Bifidobacterium reuteri]